MSDWEVDGVTDNAWSSFDEVAWIECEEKGDHSMSERGILRDTSGTPEELLKKSIEIFTQSNVQGSSYNVKERNISPNDGIWSDFSPGNPIDVSPSNRAACTIRCGPQAEHVSEDTDYDFERASEMCRDGPDYHDDGADIVNSSCQFLLSEVCPPGGDLEFLAEAHGEGRRDNLLEYGWGHNNIEDMGKLFSSSDSILSQGFDNNTDGMLWEPPSSELGGNLGSMQHPVKVPVSPEFISRGDMNGMETKTDLSTSTTMARFTRHETYTGPRGWNVQSKQGNSSDLEASGTGVHVENYTECSKEKTWSQRTSEGHCRELEDDVSDGYKEANNAGKVMHVGASPTDNGSTHAFNEGDKWRSSKARRHGPRSKRLEQNSRKPISGRKLAFSVPQPQKFPLVYVPVVPRVQDSPPCSTPISQITQVHTHEPISPLPCLQPVPYVHTGFGFPAQHHMSVAVSGSPIVPQQQAQPVFIGYRPPFIDIPKLQQSKKTCEGSSQSPTASSTMTPQEKIEKLRWRQKMQARLAVEQQQQQLINQHLIPEQTQFEKQHKHQNRPHLNSSEESVRLAHAQCAEPSVWKEGSISMEGATPEDGDESLAATILQQLLNIASKMDTRTRLCLRDGFCRLAGNAMQRRAAGDSRGSKRSNAEPFKESCMAESPPSSEQSCSQRLLTVEDIVETETNPMDRFIAHLLFHKRFAASVVPMYMNSNPCNISEKSKPALLQQNARVWQEANTSSVISAVPQSSLVDGKFGPSNWPNIIVDEPASNTMCENPIGASACLPSIISGLHLDRVLCLPTRSADNSLPHPPDTEIDMIDIDRVLPSVVTISGNMDSFGEVQEPLLPVT